MTTPITASMLYDLVRCPTRLAMDLFGDPNEREPASRFVQLLWERGHAFEREVIEALSLPYTDLSGVPTEEREARTEEALERGDELIYQGRISAGDLLGQPDLLRREGDGYVAGDIKSGAGEEGGTDLEDGKPKKHYGVQLALYTEILERKGICASRRPFVWDIRGREVPYDLDAALGPKRPGSMWDHYGGTLEAARSIIARREAPRPAIASSCKLCHWRRACRREAEREDDLTLIPELGRASRDVLIENLPSAEDLATADLAVYVTGKKTTFSRIGASTLSRFQERARLLKDPNPKPYLKAPLSVPHTESELFFDIETDPFRDICYLHGFVERRGRDNNTESYVSFLAGSPSEEGERTAFAQAFEYVISIQPRTLYFYSKYERTWWRRLQDRHPDVATPDDIEALFAAGAAVDLYYDVVRKKSVWPTHDHSLKTLATYLGFEWRDTDPSGAESIEWYHRWVETGDEAVKQRILEYNEDDCRAARVLLDALIELPVIDD